MFIPSEKRTILTYLSRPVLQDALSSLTAPRDTFWRKLGINKTDRPFLGEIGEDRFKMLYSGNERSKPGSLTVCSGTIEETPEGAQLHIHLRPTFGGQLGYVVLFPLAAIVLIYLVGIMVMLCSGQSVAKYTNTPSFCLPCIFAVTPLLEYLYDRYCIKKSKELILERIAEYEAKTSRQEV